MNIIAQGLRRSGTTIVYDIISQDKRISSYYEPLSLCKPSIGGGSKLLKHDVSYNTRKIREDFCNYKKIKLNHSDFNFGAPTNYLLEINENSLSPFLKEYIRFTLMSAPNCFLKFTRASLFIEDLYNISNDSLFLHIIKNPIKWTSSHICVDYNTTLSKNANIFFGLKDNFNMWSQENISNFVINKYDKKYLTKPAYFKLLYLWNFLNKKTETDGRIFFNSNYIKVYNDSLHLNYKEYLDIIYDKYNLEPNYKVYEWCNINITPPKEFLFKDDSRWREAFDELGIDFDFLNS